MTRTGRMESMESRGGTPKDGRAASGKNLGRWGRQGRDGAGARILLFFEVFTG